MPAKSRKDRGEDSSSDGEFGKHLEAIGGARAVREAKKAQVELEAREGSRRTRAHRYAAGKRVIVHEDETDYRENGRVRHYRREAEKERRRMAVQYEEKERRLRRRQRRNRRREERRGRQGQRARARQHSDSDGPDEVGLTTARIHAKRDGDEGSYSYSYSEDAAAPVAVAAPVAAVGKTAQKAIASPSPGVDAGAACVSGYGVHDDLNAQHKKVQEDDSFIDAKIDDKSSLFIVFDGHAGRGAVDYAKANLGKAIASALKSKPTIEDALTDAFETVDAAVIQQKSEGEGSPGTTVVATLIRDNRLYCANAGDARAVLSRGGKAERLSYDHKASDADEVARCEAAGGAFLWGRLQGQTMITRAIGDADLKPYCTATPSFKEVELDSSCDFVALVCDGVTDVMEDQQIIDIVKPLLPDCTAAARALVDQSLTLGTKDNLTAMVVSFRV